MKNIKIALQTDVGLGLGEITRINVNNDNVWNPISEIANRNTSLMYVVPSDNLYMLNGVPMANAWVLELLNKQNKGYSRFVVTRQEQIPINSLDALIMRGDDIESNHNLELVYSSLDRSSLFIPIELSDMKATKDKLDTAKRFADLNIPLTYYAEDQSEMNERIVSLFDDNHEYVVLKYRFGFGGKQVVRVDQDNFETKGADFFNTYKQIIIQEYDSSVTKGDIRSIVYDGKYVGGFERITGGSSWLSNISAGGRASYHKPLPGEIELCEQIANRFSGLKFVGIDLFHSLRLIEVNGYSGGFDELKEYHGIDLAKRLIDDVYSFKQRKGE